MEQVEEVEAALAAVVSAALVAASPEPVLGEALACPAATVAAALAEAVECNVTSSSAG